MAIVTMEQWNHMIVFVIDRKQFFVYQYAHTLSGVFFNDYFILSQEFFNYLV